MFLGSKIGFICQVRIVQPIDIVINEKIENNHTYRDTRIEQRYFTSYLHYDSPFNEIP